MSPPVSYIVIFVFLVGSFEVALSLCAGFPGFQSHVSVSSVVKDPQAFAALLVTGCKK